MSKNIVFLSTAWLLIVSCELRAETQSDLPRMEVALISRHSTFGRFRNGLEDLEEGLTTMSCRGWRLRASSIISR
jgi:hypothetical protein